MQKQIKNSCFTHAGPGDHEATLRPSKSRDCGATRFPLPQDNSRTKTAESLAGNSILLAPLFAGAWGELIDGGKDVVVRGARADDGDEAVQRIPIALPEEVKQPVGVGPVVVESGCGRWVATILVTQRSQIQLFMVQI